MDIQKEQHVHNFSNLIQSNISLSDKNWFQTGGPAEFFAEPTTDVEMVHAVIRAQQENLPITLLGKGANVLVSDEGVAGLVIRPHLNELSHELITDQIAHVKAGAGTDLDELITYCLSNELLGLEEFSGIPGTVGGAVYINLHYFEFLLSHFFVGANVLDVRTGLIKVVDKEWFKFGYNTSKLHEGNYILLEATFRLIKAEWFELYYAQGRREEIIRHRRAKYPQKNTCGSFFRNFYESEVSLERDGKRVIWVAYYLDKIGVKGELSYGDARVSYQHANMIVNQGSATSHDIIELACAMQKKVKDAFGLIPQPECRLIGFSEYPLMR